jgi:hypothetical protein
MASRADGNKHEEKRELTPMRNALSPKPVDLSAMVVDLVQVALSVTSPACPNREGLNLLKTPFFTQDVSAVRIAAGGTGDATPQPNQIAYLKRLLFEAGLPRYRRL